MYTGCAGNETGTAGPGAGDSREPADHGTRPGGFPGEAAKVRSRPDTADPRGFASRAAAERRILFTINGLRRRAGGLRRRTEATATAGRAGARLIEFNGQCQAGLRAGRDGSMDFREASGIIIPAFNAEGFLADTLGGLLRRVEPTRVAVVDDGSGDGTAGIAMAAGVTCLRHEANLGKGSALMTGLLWAREKGLSWAVTMDADGQHDPDDLESFWKAPVAGDTAVVVGRRAMRGSAMPAHRRFSNFITTRMVSGLAGKPVYDAQCGFRMYRLDAIAKAGLPRHGRFEWEAQALVLGCRRGFSVVPVDIATVYTDNGSHMRLARDSIRFLKMYWRLAWTP